MPSLTALFFRSILALMKGFWKVVLPPCVILAFLSNTAPAQTNTTARTSRKYDSRVQMHTAPVTLRVPDDSRETQKGASEPSERNLPFPSSITPESQIRPNGPRLKASLGKKQNKNWILPSSTDTGEKDESSSLDQQEELVTSGWGWLADDVRARQQKQKEMGAKEENDSKEKDNEFQPPSALPKEDVKTKPDGLFLDTAFTPVSGSILTKESRNNGSKDTSARDERQEEQTSRAAGPTTAESPLNRTSADQPKEQKFGADATWGNEHLWNKGEKTVSALPQTEALLSMSKFNAQKPLAELDRPIFKPDVGGNGVEPNRLESSSRTLVTASSFQPLPAAPVNDLGTRPWSVDSAGTTPFGKSTPSSSEPAIAPSQPIESLKAPELPKPVTSPWLK